MNKVIYFVTNEEKDRLTNREYDNNNYYYYICNVLFSYSNFYYNLKPIFYFNTVK